MDRTPIKGKGGYNPSKCLVIRGSSFRNNKMEKKLARADKIMKNLEQKTGLSKAGADWLVAVLDPFHDSKLECTGYPDREMSSSVTQVVPMSVTVKRPALLAGTDQFGLHAWIDDHVLPIDGDGTGNRCRQGFTKDNLLTLAYDITLDADFPTGGLTIVAFNDTGAALETCLIDGTNRVLAAQLSADPSYFTGRTRVIAAGFEVHNVTPELTRGGSLCVYEQPQAEETPATWAISSNRTAPFLDTLTQPEKTSWACSNPTQRKIFMNQDHKRFAKFYVKATEVDSKESDRQVVQSDKSVIDYVKVMNNLDAFVKIEAPDRKSVV